MSISCHYSPVLQGLQFALYKANTILYPFSSSSRWEFSPARPGQSGDYTCAGKPSNENELRSSNVYIHIHELFSQPVIRMNPNPVTEGDTLSLTCDTQRGRYGENTQLVFVFYKGKDEVQRSLSSEYRLPSVRVQHSGEYRCAAVTPDNRVYKASLTITIQVPELFSRPQIRVNPNPIREGDTLSLTCDTQRGQYGENTQLVFVFYKGRNEVQRSLSSEYRLPSVRVYDSGDYSCAAATPDNTVYKESPPITIQIPEMFSEPELTVSSNPITEGSALTLTCVITSSTVSTRELQFAFYWDGQELQGFTSSNQYQVYSVQLEDSGNYSCKVQHPATGISKASEVSYIQAVGGAVRPVVSLSPNWANILTGDKVTLTCDVGSTAGTAPRYSWYKDSEMMNKDTLTNKHTINYAWKTNSGTYQCQTDTSERSEPVSVSVTDGPLILQAPLYVYEGDSLTMRCYRMFGWDTMFYKDNNPVGPTYGDELHIEGVNMTVTGTYRCSKGKTYQSGEVFISVRELFSRPEIKVSPCPPAEGSNMTITCDTVLHPSRITTPLLFAFYINGNTVREFSLSKKYRVYSTGPGDWGDYSCAVRTPTGTVLKLSSVTHIQIHAKSRNVLLSVGLPLLAIIILIIAVGIYKFRHKIGQTKPPSDQSNTGIPLSKTPAVAKDEEPVYHQIQTGAPPAEQDMFYTYIDVSHLKKTSPAPPPNPNNNEIIYSQVMPSK
uniref:Ig-like domain-containing protein n=1 Tax=Xenopus tropicalis TaxID=8364 RepID=A0A803JPV2_XENTR